MKIYLFLDNNKIIYGYHTQSVMPDTEIIHEISDVGLSELANKVGKVKYENGVIKDVVTEYIVTADSIRKRRVRECFLIINRGNLWYQSLTEAQLIELSQWYNAWLNAPETLVVPEKPSWL